MTPPLATQLAKVPRAAEKGTMPALLELATPLTTAETAPSGLMLSVYV